MVSNELVTGAALRCKSCGVFLEASRVDLTTRLAACALCNRVFTLGADSTRAAQRVIPEAFDGDETMHLEGAGYRDPSRPRRTTWRFHGAVSVGVPLAFLGLMAIGLVAFPGTMALWSGRAPGADEAAVALLVLLLGLGLLYAGLVAVVNRRTVSVGADSIRLESRPLPWPGKALPRRGARGALAFGGNARSDTAAWVVRVIGADRRARNLVGHLTEEEARYLADEMTEALAARVHAEPSS